MTNGILVGIIPTVDHSVGLVHHRIQGGQVDVLSVVCIVIEGNRKGQRTGDISLGWLAIKEWTIRWLHRRICPPSRTESSGRLSWGYSIVLLVIHRQESRYTQAANAKRGCIRQEHLDSAS